MQIILFSEVQLALASQDAYTEKILQIHSEYRQQILDCKVDRQPAAKRMPPLLQAWDEKLSSQAKTSSETRRTGFCHPKSSKLYSDAQYIGANPIVEQ
ncbi:unnamed protein product [Trichobilharzia regenti]|nr:unnamed protein product [Trichobilharzia regenti]